MSEDDPPSEAEDPAPPAHDWEDPVDLGVELLAHLEHPELSVADAMDVIETVSREPSIQHEILDRAVARGVIERDDGTVRPTTGDYVSFEADVVRKEGEFSCRRCGAGLSAGHFVRFESGEWGPFGPECVRKVLGRD